MGTSESSMCIGICSVSVIPASSTLTQIYTKSPKTLSKANLALRGTQREQRFVSIQVILSKLTLSLMREARFEIIVIRLWVGLTRNNNLIFCYLCAVTRRSEHWPKLAAWESHQADIQGRRQPNGLGIPGRPRTQRESKHQAVWPECS